MIISNFFRNHLAKLKKITVNCYGPDGRADPYYRKAKLLKSLLTFFAEFVGPILRGAFFV